MKVAKLKRLAILLFLICMLQFSVNCYAQKITLVSKNIHLSDVFKSIERQTNFLFFYDKSLLEKTPAIDVALQNATIEQALDSCLQDHALTYSIVKNTVVIQAGKQSSSPTIFHRSNFIYTAASPPPPNQINGTVTNKEGTALNNVSVQIAGTKTGTTTNSEGRFTLTIDSDENVRLEISSIGFKTQILQTDKQTTTYNIVLEEAVAGLDEVIVVGYGTQRKTNLTGAVEQVTSHVLESRPITNLGQGLQGTISNLQVTQNSFAPGQGATFNIRGFTSLNGGGPLILVDGVVQDPNLLNPDDVESVSVLKDAASAAIYGARAAFGVMLITTKKGGKNQKPTLKLNSSYSVTNGTKIPKHADSKEYIEYINDASVNAGGSNFFDQRQIDNAMAYYNNPGANSPVYYDAAIDLDGKYRYSGNTDWSRELYKNGTMQQTGASISGGSNKTQYYASYGYMKQNGLLRPYNDSYARHNIVVNITSEIVSWLTVSARTKYTYGFEDHPSGGLGSSGLTPTSGQQKYDLSPLMPVRHPDGSWSGQGSVTNPFAVGEEGGYDQSKVNDFWITGAFTLRPLKGLTINGDYTFNPYSQNRNRYIRMFYEKWADGRSNPYAWTNPNSITVENNNNYYTALNAYADYSYSTNNHNFKALVGYNHEIKNSKFFSAQRANLIDNNLPAINRATGVQTVNGSETVWAVQGIFSRLNYDYAGKYLLELNGRYDGSSKFQMGDRFAFFPSVSAGWRMSKENFWEGIKDVVSDAKIRGSYGLLGNQNVTGDFPYISSYNINTALNYVLAGARPVSITAGGLISPSFTWEKVNQWNIGVDLGLFNNKLTTSFDLYERSTIGMLTTGQPLPAILGTGVPRENAADLKTKGWDWVVDWNNGTRDFSYNIRFNISDAMAEITKFSNPTGLLSENYVGKKIGEIWGYDSPGLFQSDAEATAWADQSQFYTGKWNAGDVKYIDRNGDKKLTRGANTLTDPGDQYIIGNTTPRYQYGLQLGGTLKGFDVTVFLQGVGKRDFWITNTGDRYRYFGNNGSAGWVPMKAALDYWSPANPDAFFPKQYLSGFNLGAHGNHQASTRYLQNAAYIRFKQITVGYAVPKKIISKAAMSNAHIYFTMQNIFTLSKMSELFDPEAISLSAYPAPLAFNTGINITF